MNEIILTNAHLRAVAGAKYAGEATLSFTRRCQSSEIKKLPAELRKEIAALCRLLDELIPKDFGYQLILGDEKPALLWSYDDGPITQFSSGWEVKQWLSVREQFAEIDWSQMRTVALSNTSFFDELSEAAKAAPENVPATRKLQEKFREEVDAFITETTAEGTHVLMWGNEEGLEEERFENLAAFKRELPNLMTCAYQVIALVVNGKAEAAHEIDRMKRAALDELRDMPISHAKASGRVFPPTVLD